MARDLTFRSVAKLKARGEFDSVRHAGFAACQPLTADECLEVLALGELLARYYRPPGAVHQAVKAGVSWRQVGEAMGSTVEQAKLGYLRWAEASTSFGLITRADSACPMPNTRLRANVP